MQIKNTTKQDMTIRGVEFEAGKVISVTDESLALKVMGIPGLVQNIPAPRTGTGKSVYKKVKKNDADKA